MFQRETIVSKQLVLLGASVCLGATLSAGAAKSEDTVADIRIATGIEYTTGDYGGSGDIDETYAPFTLSVTGGRMGARLTVPYLSVSGPEAVLHGETDGEVNPADTPQVRESGLGDIVASVTVFDVIDSRRLDLAVDLTGKIKFGTADARTGLGTGEDDYSVLVDVYKFVGRGALVGTVGYKFRGEPEGVSLEDVMLGSVGALVDVGARSRFGLFYDYREASLLDADELRELSLFGSHDLNGAWRMQYYIFTGFTNSGPDWGAGLNVGVNLPRSASRYRD